MIRDDRAGWLKEFLLARTDSEQERINALEIHATFKALWKVYHAAEKHLCWTEGDERKIDEDLEHALALFSPSHDGS